MCNCHWEQGVKDAFLVIEKNVKKEWTEGRDWDTSTLIEAEKQMNRDRDRERGPRSQTQGQRDSDRDNCRSTMEQTKGQAAMDMDWGTQTCRNRRTGKE